MRSINFSRRQFVGSWLALLAGWGLVSPGIAQAAWSKSGFQAKSLDAALAALGALNGLDSGDGDERVMMDVPEIAENGAVVPMRIVSTLAQTTRLAILIEDNPFPLAAIFHIPAGTVPDVQVRCKMAQTSLVHVLAEAGGKFYSSKKLIKVILGGCGD